VTRDQWLATHPYLRPLAEMRSTIDAAAARLDVSRAPIPDWDAYAADFNRGVPLLRSSQAAIDLRPVEEPLRTLVGNLTSASLPGVVAEQCRALDAELRSTQGTAVAGGLSEQTGLLRCLAWAVISRYLAEVEHAFAAWRNDERWLRNYCPLCGERPAMAQLVGKDPGRRRFLVCGCCGVRWQYRRTACPFCDSQDTHQVSVIAIEGEKPLRLDSCEVCSGYVKTYDGEGSEPVLLADWTSVHLDVLARERGLKRLAASLYEV